MTNQQSVILTIGGAALISLGLWPLVEMAYGRWAAPKISSNNQALSLRTHRYRQIAIGSGSLAIAIALFAGNGIPVGLLIGWWMQRALRLNDGQKANDAERAAHVRDIAAIGRLVELGVDIRDAWRKVGATAQASYTHRAIAGRLRTGSTMAESLAVERTSTLPGMQALRTMLPRLLQSGAPIVPLLNNVVETAVAQQEMADKRKTLSAQGRMQARVLTILPIGILPILMGLDERFAAYYQSDIGGGVLLFGVAALLLAAQAWLERIVGGGR